MSKGVKNLKNFDLEAKIKESGQKSEEIHLGASGLNALVGLRALVEKKNGSLTDYDLDSGDAMPDAVLRYAGVGSYIKKVSILADELVDMNYEPMDADYYLELFLGGDATENKLGKFRIGDFAGMQEAFVAEVDNNVIIKEPCDAKFNAKVVDTDGNIINPSSTGCIKFIFHYEKAEDNNLQ